MSMINHQIEELKAMAKGFRQTEHPRLAQKIDDAIDTIETLSAKVRYQNMNASQKDAVCYLLQCNDSETPNSSDLISRQAAIDALNEVSKHYTDKGREWHPHVDFMVQAIEDLPSADIPTKIVAQITFDEEKLREIVKKAVERLKEEYEITDRPTGKWLKSDGTLYEGKPDGSCWCSECGTWLVASDEYDVSDNFCPHCGAKMGVKDE